MLLTRLANDRTQVCQKGRCPSLKVRLTYSGMVGYHSFGVWKLRREKYIIPAKYQFTNTRQDFPQGNPKLTKIICRRDLPLYFPCFQPKCVPGHQKPILRLIRQVRSMKSIWYKTDHLEIWSIDENYSPNLFSGHHRPLLDHDQLLPRSRGRSKRVPKKRFFLFYFSSPSSFSSQESEWFHL